jgi:hypothetical protein
MAYAKKVVLHCTDGYRMRLDPLVEDFIRDGVIFVAVVGKGCAEVEDMIDELVLGDDGTREYHLLTSSHPNQSIQEAIEFASSLTGEFSGPVQIVEL